jgi:hypothetical protein
MMTIAQRFSAGNGEHFLAKSRQGRPKNDFFRPWRD